MNRLLTLAAALAFANVLALAVTPATAGPRGLQLASVSPTEDMCALLDPCIAPAQYRSGPFREPPVIREVSYRALGAICDDASASGHALGCAQLTATECIVHLPREIRGLSPDLYRLIREHELAHCRGWVHG